MQTIYYYYVAALALCVPLHSLYTQTLLSEDFANGFPLDWISILETGNGTPSSGWMHTFTGTQSEFRIADLNGPTANNGWMIFDSGFNCAVGGAQDAWLISPIINASEAPTVWLEFATHHQSFNDQPQLRIGSNLQELADWHTIVLFPDLEPNRFVGPDPIRGEVNPAYVRLNLTEWLAGTDELRIAFQFLSDRTTIDDPFIPTGCAYAWQLDDVRLSMEDPTPLFDMAINPFAAIAPNFSTPICQVSPMHFMADVGNRGQITPDSTVLKIEMFDQSNALVFTDSIVYGPIARDSVAENVFFSQSFLPPSEVQTYQAAYSLQYPGMEEDGFPEDNFRTFAFRVTADQFSKEIGATRLISPRDVFSYTFGNVFYVPKGQGNAIEDISFAVGNSEQLVGKTVTLFVAEWDGVHDGDLFIPAQAYQAVGFGDYTFDGTESTNRINIPIETTSSEPVSLQDNTYYIAAVRYQATDQTPLRLLASEAHDYSATLFQTDSLERPQYAAALSVGRDERLDLIGFGNDIIPTIRMKTAPCQCVSTTSLPLRSDLARLFPNPASRRVQVQLQDRDIGSASWQLYGSDGQGLKKGAFSTTSDDLSIDIRNLPNGQYFLEITTDQGRQTLPLQKH